MDTTELTCRELVELVTEYFEGTMPEPERARFDAHLTECPYCRIYLAQLRQTITLLGRLTEESIQPDTRDELLRLFRSWKSG
jgi:anti-sigma factor RsiW